MVGNRICELCGCPTLGCTRDNVRKWCLSDVCARVCKMALSPCCTLLSTCIVPCLSLSGYVACPIGMSFLSLNDTICASSGISLRFHVPLTLQSPTNPAPHSSSFVGLSCWPLIAEKVLFGDYILNLCLEQ